jgi:GrpB-like predicted nucleotidyltransferase (UPF0157 family)/uncharacterized protein YciI
MLLALLHYKVPYEEIEAYVPEHIAFLKKGYAKGDFIVSGPRLDKKGGVILSPLTRRAVFMEILKEDPFMVHDLASYDIIAFDPSRFHPDFAPFICDPEVEEIELVPYTPQWKSQFEEEAEALSSALAETIVTIHHIGSTSIPGIVAKPIIDIIPVVKNIQAVDKLTSSLEALGYESRGEYGMPGRRFFVKKQAGKKNFNVHIFEEGHPDIERHLRFRDYLLNHPEDASAYSKLKEKLVTQSPDDMEKYSWGKEDFIKATEIKAFLWRSFLTKV